MGKTVSENRETPHVSTGMRLTEKNSPDFLKGEIISLDPKYHEDIKKDALRLSRSGDVLIAAFAGCFLIYAIVATVFYFTGIRDESQMDVHIISMLASWGLSIAAAVFFIRADRFKKAIINGSITTYRFKVVNKDVSDGEGKKSNYIYFGGVMTYVDNASYKDTAIGDYVYCAVIEHEGLRFFCYLGKKYILPD